MSVLSFLTPFLLFSSFGIGIGGDSAKRTMKLTLNEENLRYCRICRNHPMCLFPFDHGSEKCNDLESREFAENEISSILREHNYHRNRVAQGLEIRGNPGPQPSAVGMLELMWSDELARVARRWALQCNLFQMDQCRDIERFGVWQNVDVLDMDSVGNDTAMSRMHRHIATWCDEAEDFDSSEVGLVNLATRNHTSYIAFALATLTYVGCGRAIYTDTSNRSIYRGGRRDTSRMEFQASRFRKRVEVLVCNYGPVNRSQPRHLYRTGVPGVCPPETISSPNYKYLCNRKFLRWTYPGTPHPWMPGTEYDEYDEDDEEASSAEARSCRSFPFADAVYLCRLEFLIPTVLVLRLSI